MNDELQKQLAILLSGLMNVANDAAKFAGDQIPPLVQEKIVFGRAWETTLLALMVALSCVLLYQVRKWFQWASEDEDSPAPILLSIFGTFGVLAGVVFSIVQCREVLLVWFAPRLYLVEWLKGMIK